MKGSEQIQQRIDDLTRQKKTAIARETGAEARDLFERLSTLDPIVVYRVLATLLPSVSTRDDPAKFVGALRKAVQTTQPRA